MTSSIVYVLLCASTSNPAGFDSTIEGKKNRIYRVDADAHSRHRRHRRYLSSSFVNVVSTLSSATFDVGYAHRKKIDITTPYPFVHGRFTSSAVY